MSEKRIERSWVVDKHVSSRTFIVKHISPKSTVATLKNKIKEEKWLDTFQWKAFY